MLYTKEDIPKLEKKVKELETHSEIISEACYHKDIYSDPARRGVFRLSKLINLIKVLKDSDTLEQVNWDKGGGLVLINKKFIVSLSNDKWRVIRKNIWYRHKKDIKHFIDNYVRKPQW